MQRYRMAKMGFLDKTGIRLSSQWQHYHQTEFRFQKPKDLLEIGKYNYYACNSNTHSKQYKDSPAIAFMLVPGDYFFKSDNYGSCINGQKLYVNVAAIIEDDADDKI
ncbi:hypothetical protein RDI58_026895 [Solanum bulbocastanum]|uniref:Phytocyanin domain-containing protein n=1 Tax=Solanum bulbocastanum TaxID=147425 RepID=A0AAN8SXR5_SOLBU